MGEVRRGTAGLTCFRGFYNGGGSSPPRFIPRERGGSQRSWETGWVVSTTPIFNTFLTSFPCLLQTGNLLIGNVDLSQSDKFFPSRNLCVLRVLSQRDPYEV